MRADAAWILCAQLTPKMQLQASFMISNNNVLQCKFDFKKKRMEDQRNCENMSISTVELFKYLNEHYLPVWYSLLSSLHSSCSHPRTVTVKPPRVTKRISFSIIKAASSSVYIISAASFTPAALLGLARERHVTGFLMGCANQHVWCNGVHSTLTDEIKKKKKYQRD